MSAWKKLLGIGLATATLAACGGGGSGPSGAAFVPPTITINFFTTTPDRGPSGATTRLDWASTNATTCETQVNGTAVEQGPLSGSQTRTITGAAGPYVLRLTCLGTNNTFLSRDVTYTIVPDPPRINSFTVSPDRGVSGTTAQLDWSTSNARTCTINDQSVPLSGRQTITPTGPTGTTVYRLRCENGEGTPVVVTRDVTFTIVTDTPRINSFTISPDRGVSGTAAQLDWSTSNARACTIDGQAVSLSGRQTVTPTGPAGTTVYRLRCESADATPVIVTRDVTFTITIDAPRISSFLATPDRGTSGTVTQLDWAASNVTACTIAQGAAAPIDVPISGRRAVTVTGDAGPVIFRLRCVNATNESVTRDAVFTIVTGIPQINTFVLTPSTGLAGTVTQLQWTTSNVSSCTLAQGTGEAVAVPTTALRSVTMVGPPGSVVFRLRCQNSESTPVAVTRDVVFTITLNPPVINSFTISPSTGPSGTTAELVWSASNVDSCTLREGTGAATVVPASARRSVVATQDIATGGTVVYRLECVNSAPIVERVTRDVVFTLPGPVPGIISFDVAGGINSLPTNRGEIPPENNSPYWVQLDIQVTLANGQIVPDGTNVNLRTNNVRSLVLSRLDDPATTDINEFSTYFGVINAETTGGRATFFLHSQLDAGPVIITASTVDPEVPSRTLRLDIPFTITEGPAPFKRILIDPVRTTLPANVFGIEPFWGSPFVTEVTITRRNTRGELLNSGAMNISLNPITDTAWSELDDPATTENEFLALRGAGPAQVVAGKKTIFVHSFNVPGQATQPGPFTLTVTAIDPDTGRTLSEQQVFTIVAQAVQLPANIEIIRQQTSLYVQGSGGNNTLIMQARITDAAAALIPDPPVTATFNNTQFEIVEPGAGGGEVFRGINGAGVNVEGRTIRTRTTQGIAGATLIAGNRQGTILVRVTADAADNNVDNGIRSPVTRELTVIVSDGKLFSLKITSPNVNALRINRVSGGVAPIGASTTIPTDPNGTYSLTISVLATDRQGNPVLPNTPIDFGLIDSPAAGFPASGPGSFLLSGGDGDPEEGGSLFTAPTGAFTTAGGGAGPGDTLLVFGEQSNANRDLESARRIERINGPTSLNITQRFNFNNDTGVVVNNGPVLPYVIGKATVANITPNVLTNTLGVATTTMNYPVNQLGRLAAIWARGTGEVVQGIAELVTDAELIVFPGAARIVDGSGNPILSGSLTASPNQIPANRSVPVTVCAQDALSAPIQGVQIGFTVANPSTTTTVDGQSNRGTLTAPTGSNGCTTATVVTAGVANAVQAPVITFSGVGSTAVVTVIAPTISFLQAFPSAFFGGNGGPILLRLLNGNGQPIPGVLITGVCVGAGGAQLQLTIPPGITNAAGETTARVSAINLDQPQGTASGICTFTAAGGSPSTTVTFQGINLCSIFFSPLCN